MEPTAGGFVKDLFTGESKKGMVNKPTPVAPRYKMEPGAVDPGTAPTVAAEDTAPTVAAADTAPPAVKPIVPGGASVIGTIKYRNGQIQKAGE